MNWPHFLCMDLYRIKIFKHSFRIVLFLGPNQWKPWETCPAMWDLIAITFGEVFPDYMYNIPCCNYVRWSLPWIYVQYTLLQLVRLSLPWLYVHDTLLQLVRWSLPWLYVHEALLQLRSVKSSLTIYTKDLIAVTYGEVVYPNKNQSTERAHSKGLKADYIWTWIYRSQKSNLNTLQ